MDVLLALEPTTICFFEKPLKMTIYFQFKLKNYSISLRYIVKTGIFPMVVPL